MSPPESACGTKNGGQPCPACQVVLDAVWRERGSPDGGWPALFTAKRERVAAERAEAEAAASRRLIESLESSAWYRDWPRFVSHDGEVVAGENEWMIWLGGVTAADEELRSMVHRLCGTNPLANAPGRTWRVKGVGYTGLPLGYKDFELVAA